MKPARTNTAQYDDPDGKPKRALVLHVSIYGLLFAGWLFLQLHK